ncbi:hypothetical protein A2U01_0076778, partial [Trifolium medium]|nr:hypothetical protein [Trifolium medium]
HGVLFSGGVAFVCLVAVFVFGSPPPFGFCRLKVVRMMAAPPFLCVLVWPDLGGGLVGGAVGFGSG